MYILHLALKKLFDLLAYSHLERAPDLYPQHRRVAKLFPSRVQKIFYFRRAYLRDRRVRDGLRL